MADGDQDFITPLGSFVDALSPKKGNLWAPNFDNDNNDNEKYLLPKLHR